jgi:hypothetical protein
MPLLPLLELSYMNARELVDVGATAAHLPQAVADDFPFKELVAYALAWETDYWPDNAIKSPRSINLVNFSIWCKRRGSFLV